MFMGIPLELVETSNGCPMCYPVNETPERIWASVSEIKYGALWDSSLGMAFNFTFELKRGVGCNYSCTFGSYIIKLIQQPGATTFEIVWSLHPSQFHTTIGSACWDHFENSYQNPNGVFYDGKCQISTVNPPGDITIITAADLLKVPIEDKTFCEPIPISQDVTCYRYASKKYSDKVHIVLDRS